MTLVYFSHAHWMRVYEEIRQNDENQSSPTIYTPAGKHCVCKREKEREKEKSYISDNVFIKYKFLD